MQLQSERRSTYNLKKIIFWIGKKPNEHYFLLVKHIRVAQLYEAQS